MIIVIIQLFDVTVCLVSFNVIIRAAGFDGIHNFWITYLLLYMIDWLYTYRTSLILKRFPSAWLVLGRTVLIVKNKDIGPDVVSNYCMSYYLYAKYLEADYI